MSCLHKTNIEQKQQNSKFLEVNVRLDNYFPIQKINRKTEFEFSERFCFSSPSLIRAVTCAVLAYFFTGLLARIGLLKFCHFPCLSTC